MERKLPIGYDDFKTVIKEDFYYVDKTLLIKEILENKAMVNLFTRPRRFGKSLNISMLRYFFEKPVDGISNKMLFADKKIQDAGEKYLKLQEQYPVIQLSLKSGKQMTWEDAFSMLKLEISKEYQRHRYVLELDIDKKRFESVLNETAEYSVWLEALAFLSRCLEAYYHQKVIILIDEYDVPLENAYYNGFYHQMIGFIRSLFESALKSNLSLEFAVITGCLRISRESVFTGLNNLKINSILSKAYGEYFGFTQKEVDDMLEYFGQDECSDTLKTWYEGYSFGDTEVYNPWSVINYVAARMINHKALPEEYWSNTSSNSIVRDLVIHANTNVRTELEQLIAGNSIEKVIHEDITYADIDESPENLWNFLLYTGYLKAVEVKMEDYRRVAILRIPNIEVKNIYRSQIINWTRETIRKKDLSGLYQALLGGDAEKIQLELSPLLVASISYMDNYENFYHGFILGVLMNLDGYKVTSNREAGDGRYDISIEGMDGLKVPVILEFKIADRRAELEKKAEEALQQIMDKRYDVPFIEEGYEKCIHVGIGFCKKMCRVECEVVELQVVSF